MYQYLRWMIGQEAIVVLRDTSETILEGTIKDVEETAIVICNHDGDDWVIALDRVSFVKVRGVKEQ